MTQSLQAIFERGLLRPLEPLLLREHQAVTITVSDEPDSDLSDAEFLAALDADADDSVTIESVRAAMAKIPGSMDEDFRQERDDRF